MNAHEYMKRWIMESVSDDSVERFIRLYEAYNILWHIKRTEGILRRNYGDSLPADLFPKVDESLALVLSSSRDIVLPLLEEIIGDAIVLYEGRTDPIEMPRDWTSRYVLRYRHLYFGWPLGVELYVGDVGNEADESPEALWEAAEKDLRKQAKGNSSLCGKYCRLLAQYLGAGQGIADALWRGYLGMAQVDHPGLGYALKAVVAVAPKMDFPDWDSLFIPFKLPKEISGESALGLYDMISGEFKR